MATKKTNKTAAGKTKKEVKKPPPPPPPAKKKKAVKKKPTLGSSCEYLAWHHLAWAVLTVFKENQNVEVLRGINASADTWATSSWLREEIFGRVRTLWCQRTKKDETWFPYSEDGVARMYFRFRKRNEDEIDAFEAEIEEQD